MWKALWQPRTSMLPHQTYLILLLCVSYGLCISSSGELQTFNNDLTCKHKNDPVYFAPTISLHPAHENQTLLLKLSNTSELLSISYNPWTRSVYYLEKSAPTRVSIYSVPRKTTETLEQSTENFDEIAIDPITNNIYYIADSGSVIGACNQYLRECVHLIKLDYEWQHKRLTRRNLILNPFRGQMYWVEEMTKQNAFMASMNGTSVSALQTSERVHSIALDVAKDRLFLVDDTALVLYDIKKDTYKKINSNFNASSVFFANCQLYATIKKSNEIVLVSSTGAISAPIGKSANNKLLMTSDITNGMTVPQNACMSIECSEICLIGHNNYKNDIVYTCGRRNPEWQQRKRGLMIVGTAIFAIYSAIMIIFYRSRFHS